MSEMREGLKYKVYCTGVGFYRIGAQISLSEPMHGGNVHWLEDHSYDTREEGQKALETLMEQRTPVA